MAQLVKVAEVWGPGLEDPEFAELGKECMGGYARWMVDHGIAPNRTRDEYAMDALARIKREMV